LSNVEDDKPKRQRFKRYPIGFFHFDITEVRTEEGKLSLFVAIDRTSDFAVAQLAEKTNRKTGWAFLEHLVEALHYKFHMILTDNGIQLAEQPRNRGAIYIWPMRFDLICEANRIDHRLTKPKDLWTNRQVERLNCTIKDATVKPHHEGSDKQLRWHHKDFLDTCKCTSLGNTQRAFTLLLKQ
jgi:hypothetical protein